MDTARSSVYPGVDWITLTTNTPKDGADAWSRAGELLELARAAGDKIRPWGAHGYRGLSAPHFRIGRLAESTLIELSGELADSHWRDFYPYAKNVTRFDTKVDVTFPREVRDLAIQAFHAPPKKIGKRFPPIQKHLWVNSAGGQTAYIGSPNSQKMGRLYDKHLESRGEYPPNTWRYELQTRRDASCFGARLLYCADDVPGFIKSYVSSFYARHGVTPWFKSDGVDLPSEPRKCPTPMPATLRWLERGVAPVVRRGVDAGHRDAILRALGLHPGVN
jgi:hypothetical protein